MPQQETFFEQNTGNRRIVVLKTYDRSYAREAFGHMDEAAQTHLWNSLGIDETYDPADVPPAHDPDGEDFLWEELLEAAREDGSQLSFFVVNEAIDGSSESLYVSPDWPSAEAFASPSISSTSCGPDFSWGNEERVLFSFYSSLLPSREVLGAEAIAA